jgi:hypothetical protein
MVDGYHHAYQCRGDDQSALSLTSLPTSVAMLRILQAVTIIVNDDVAPTWDPAAQPGDL